MLSTSVKPSDILVIDDNESWLNCLTNLNVNVLNATGKAYINLFEELKEINATFKFVLINKNLKRLDTVKRTDDHGLFIGQSYLEDSFPQTKFVYLSFTVNNTVDSFLNYIDFLTYICDGK